MYKIKEAFTKRDKIDKAFTDRDKIKRTLMGRGWVKRFFTNLSRSVVSRGIGRNRELAEMGAPAQTGPLRLGIVGQAPEHRFQQTHFIPRITSILE